MTQPWSNLPRVPLAALPTPLQRLDRFGEAIGAEVWIKRDDVGSIGLAGNKVRKLEYVLADALAEGADTIVIIGAEQSNACRATAAACAQLGLRCVLVLSGDGAGRAERQPAARPPVRRGGALRRRRRLGRAVGGVAAGERGPERRRRAAVLAAGRQLVAARRGGVRRCVVSSSRRSSIAQGSDPRTRLLRLVVGRDARRATARTRSAGGDPSCARSASLPTSCRTRPRYIAGLAARRGRAARGRRRDRARRRST